MKSNSFIAMSLVALVAGGGFFVASDALASHSFDLEERRQERAERRAEREAEREARRAEREAEREARRAERLAEREAEEEEVEPPCDCSSRLKFSDPDLQWRGGSLYLVPRVDIDIRTRGDWGEGEPWNVVLKYNGKGSYSSEDITAPSHTPTFSGSKKIAGGMCGDYDYEYEGYALPAVKLTGLTPSLLTGDQELEGIMRMHAELQGCDNEEETRELDFELESFGNLDVGRWGFAR